MRASMRLQRQLGRNQSVQLLNGDQEEIGPPCHRRVIPQKRYRLGLHLAMACLRIAQQALPHSTAQLVFWGQALCALVPWIPSPVSHCRSHANHSLYFVTHQLVTKYPAHVCSSSSEL